LDQFRPEIEAFLMNGSTQKFIAKRYNTTEANLSSQRPEHRKDTIPYERAVDVRSINGKLPIELEPFNVL